MTNSLESYGGQHLSQERPEWNPVLQLAHTQLQAVRRKLSFGKAQSGVPRAGQNTYLKSDSTQDGILLFNDEKVLQNLFDSGVPTKKEGKFLQLGPQPYLSHFK